MFTYPTFINGGELAFAITNHDLVVLVNVCTMLLSPIAPR